MQIKQNGGKFDCKNKLVKEIINAQTKIAL